MKTASKILVLAFAVVLAGLGACSPKKFAVNQIGNAISGGSSVYLSDNDPELVKEAIPFGLKTYESLLEVSPRHRGLLLSAASGFISYAYLLSEEADAIDYDDFRRAQDLRARAANLYLRGRDYAVRGLNLEDPAFMENISRDTDGTLARVDQDDVAFLYWAAAGWAGALSVAKDNTDLIAALPYTGAMMERVVALDPGFNDGAAYEFLISFEGASPNGDPVKAREFYTKALSVNGGKLASTYLALAEAVSVPDQDLEEFRRLINAALDVDVDAVPQNRLVNILAHRRAERLKEEIPDLFLDAAQ